jgi:hypothetical protein
MKHAVSRTNDLSFLVTDENIAYMEKHARSQNYHKVSIESTNRDPDELFSAFLGCSRSKMFDKYPLVNGFQVIPPSPLDEIYVVNIQPSIVRTVRKDGVYSAVYDLQSNATITITREAPNAQQSG